jgi:hypothetical protein
MHNSYTLKDFIQSCINYEYELVIRRFRFFYLFSSIAVGLEQGETVKESIDKLSHISKYGLKYDYDKKSTIKDSSDDERRVYNNTFVEKDSLTMYMLSITNEENDYGLHIPKHRTRYKTLFLMAVIQYIGAVRITERLRELNSKDEEISVIYKELSELNEIVLNFRLHYFFNNNRISTSDYCNFIWGELNWQDEIANILENFSIGYEMVTNKISSMKYEQEEVTKKKNDRRWKVISIIGSIFAVWGIFDSISAVTNFVVIKSNSRIYEYTFGINEELNLVFLMFAVSLVLGIFIGISYDQLSKNRK